MIGLAETWCLDATGRPLGAVLPILVLVLARTAPLAFVAPWLTWSASTALVRGALAFALALAMTPIALAAPSVASAEPLRLLSQVVLEALVGTSFALASSVPLYALRWAGELLDRMGLPPRPSIATPGPMSRLYLATGVTLFVILGGHRVAIGAFAESFTALPVGAIPVVSAWGIDFALGVGRIVTAALGLAIAIALPAALALIVLELGFGVAGRLAPIVRGWSAAVTIRAGLAVGLALLTLSAAIGRLGPAIGDSLARAADLLAP
ncbi:MAG: flagellar biosynthetic protein FliR [Sandaracinaceae bacterium]